MRLDCERYAVRSMPLVVKCKCKERSFGLFVAVERFCRESGFEAI